MKKVLSLLLLFSIYQSYCQKPKGDPITQAIDQSGGTITSSDKKLELIFPQGALTTKTTITIQPEENLNSAGSGLAYRMEPSGTQFNKPVQLIYHYSPDESDECPPDFMALGMQNDKGIWSYVEYDDWDSINNILKGHIQHFSHFSNLKQLRLQSVPAEIHPQDTAAIYLIDIGHKLETDSLAFLKLDQTLVWFINNVDGGNEKTGRIVPGSQAIGKSAIHYATYLAPRYMSNALPARVRVDVYAPKQQNSKVVYKKRSLNLRLQLYDAYRVKLGFTVPARAEMGNELRDSAEFTLEIADGLAVADSVANFPLWLAKNKETMKCLFILDSKDPIGYIDLDNLPRVALADSTADIQFKGKNVIAYKWHWRCRPVGDLPTNDMYEDTIPEGLTFYVNRKGQDYEDERGVRIHVSPRFPKGK